MGVGGGMKYQRHDIRNFVERPYHCRAKMRNVPL